MVRSRSVVITCAFAAFGAHARPRLWPRRVPALKPRRGFSRRHNSKDRTAQSYRTNIAAIRHAAALARGEAA